ncbi:dehydrodolichyl diphosphate synthase [Microdochium trichocladiopsis]|uniref:Alkyl transferase n=1 Tax=Microdochium trichocladiopsis TaxID=1682393 RepID=A0A9P9BKF7_9PEZI|nr:dehydrodolichyl diphosphate synthase [Microdochium trichocladiopsis]KAH7021179.1 dehydrodolichyl diphosphate synthase [Microdochium trichocladiopsis]
MSDLHVSNIKRWLFKSPPVEWAIWTAREILIGTLRQGPIPQHVAFEMDGNRRYAKNHQIETIQGHHLGFEALSRVLEICYKSGVKVVTVYAFSIENFNRPKSEVKGLMAMAKVKLEQLVQHGELLDRYGARVKICGERNLIPADVLPFVDKAVEMTKHNKDAVLNICFPYTARAEMTSAIKATIDEFTSPAPLPQPSAPFSQSRIEQKIRDNQAKSGTGAPQRDASPEAVKSDVDDSGRSSTAIDPDSPTLQATGRASLQNPENITAETINSHTYTAEDPPLDIFIRTSGVRRLSDFMLWQCHENTHIFFLQCYWPDFDLWNFVPVLLEWQWRQKKTMEKEGVRRRVKERAE